MGFEDEIVSMRKKIDAIDQQLIDLLGERFRYCLAVGNLKKRYDEPVMQPNRVQEVINRAVTAGASHGVSSEFASCMWELIIAEACRMEECQPTHQRMAPAN